MPVLCICAWTRIQCSIFAFSYLRVRITQGSWSFRSFMFCHSLLPHISRNFWPANLWLPLVGWPSLPPISTWRELFLMARSLWAALLVPISMRRDLLLGALFFMGRTLSCTRCVSLFLHYIPFLFTLLHWFFAFLAWTQFQRSLYLISFVGWPIRRSAMPFYLLWGFVSWPVRWSLRLHPTRVCWLARSSVSHALLPSVGVRQLTRSLVAAPSSY